MAKIDLTGKVAIVTGASRGMGREMADAIIEAGGKAGLLSPDVAELKKRWPKSMPRAAKAEPWPCPMTFQIMPNVNWRAMKPSVTLGAST